MTAWYKDPKMQQALDKMGLELGKDYEYHERIPIKDIDLEASKSNNARIGGDPVVAGHERFIRQMKAGDKFPCNTLHRLPSGKLYIDAGVNRIVASKATGDRTVAGFIIKNATDKQFNFLRRSDNAKHGFGQIESESIEHCLELMNDGVAIRKLSREFGIDPAKLRAAKRADDVLVALNKARVAGGEKLSRTTRIKMHKLIDLASGKILADTARAMLRFHPHVSQKDVHRLVTAVKRAKTTETKISAITRWEKRCRANYRPAEKLTRKRRPHRDRLSTELLRDGGFLDWLENGNTNASGGSGPFITTDDLQLDLEDIEKFTKTATTLVQRLRSIFPIKYTKGKGGKGRRN